MLRIARYKIGMMGWGYTVETLSVHSGVGLKQVGTEMIADLESCSLYPSSVFSLLPLPCLGQGS